MGWDEYIFNRMLVAIPDFQLDSNFLALGRRVGAISAGDEAAYLAVADKIAKIRGTRSFIGTLRGKSLIQRLLILEPEILSVRTIDFLRRGNLISVTEGNALRAALRGARLLVPALGSDVALTTRFTALYGSIASTDMVNLIRNLDDARIYELRLALLGDKTRLSSKDAAYIRKLLVDSINRSQQMRSAIALARVGATTYQDLTKARNIWAAITVLGDSFLSDAVLRNAIRVGIIPRERYVLIRALEQLGLSAWKRGLNAFQYESWYARGLMLSEGVLSTEMVEALRAGGIISNDLAKWLNPAASMIRVITRSQAEQYRGSRRIRIAAGETPIRTYAKATRLTDRAIVELLAEASEDARKDIEKIMSKKTIGARARRAQQSLIRRTLNRNMRALWERVGYLTIHGEKEAAIAAVESSMFLQDELWGKGGKDFQRTIEAQARAGMDSLMSREENILPLSKRVYTNMGLSRTRVVREVQKALLRGLSSRDIAKVAAQYISPNTPGGVSYAAKRLARTEINNAFHFTQIRYTREMPWVRGYQWMLSGSHPEPDICDDMAKRDHDGLGAGIYKKAHVPGKAHPNCFPSGTLVSVNVDDVRAVTKRRYSGELVQVFFAGSCSPQLSGTPNHPALTLRGWVPLGELVEGDYVIGDLGSNGMCGGDPDDQKVESRIEDVFTSLDESGCVSSTSVPSSPEDFHGDGSEGDVDIVWPDIPLVLGDVSREQSGELKLEGGDSELSLETSSRTVDLLTEGDDATSDGIVGGLGSQTFQLGRDEVCGLLLGSERDFRSLHGAPDCSDADVEVMRNVVQAVPGKVVAYKVSVTKRIDFDGHVYNLQTKSGFYTAEGITVHNCFCFLTTVTDKTGAFEKGLRNGKYDSYLKQAEREGPLPDAYTRDLRSATTVAAQQAALTGGKILAAKALGAASETVATAARSNYALAALR